jgi:hypothetical protein
MPHEGSIPPDNQEVQPQPQQPISTESSPQSDQVTKHSEGFNNDRHGDREAFSIMSSEQERQTEERWKESVHRVNDKEVAQEMAESKNFGFNEDKIEAKLMQEKFVDEVQQKVKELFGLTKEGEITNPQVLAENQAIKESCYHEFSDSSLIAETETQRRIYDNLARHISNIVSLAHEEKKVPGRSEYDQEERRFSYKHGTARKTTPEVLIEKIFHPCYFENPLGELIPKELGLNESHMYRARGIEDLELSKNVSDTIESYKELMDIGFGNKRVLQEIVAATLEEELLARTTLPESLNNKERKSYIIKKINALWPPEEGFTIHEYLLAVARKELSQRGVSIESDEE